MSGRFSEIDVGDPKLLTSMLQLLRETPGFNDHKDKPIVRIGNEVIFINGRIGNGGTKSVYDVEIGYQPYALALPNAHDHVQNMIKKWAAVLNEPHHTDRLRALGLVVNPDMRLLPVEVFGIPFQALQMTRFRDLTWEVRDHKNPSSSVFRTQLIPPEGLTPTNFRDLFQGVLSDLRTLAVNRIGLQGDSINLAVTNGVARLFLNDLGKINWDLSFTAEVCRNYVIAGVAAFHQALTREEEEQNSDFFDQGMKRTTENDPSYFEALSEELFASVI
jgi:hypothetical protein